MDAIRSSDFSPLDFRHVYLWELIYITYLVVKENIVIVVKSACLKLIKYLHMANNSQRCVNFASFMEPIQSSYILS